MDDSLLNILLNWKTFGSNVGTLTEDQALEMMNYELLTKRRKMVVERLHMRYSGLKVKREREELLRGL